MRGGTLPVEHKYINCRAFGATSLLVRESGRGGPMRLRICRILLKNVATSKSANKDQIAIG